MIVKSSEVDIPIDEEGRYDKIRFDLEEYERYYGHKSEEYDILDLGYWNSIGVYFGAAPAYRWLPIAESVVRDQQYTKVEGVILDYTTASMLVNAYNGLTPENALKFKHKTLWAATETVWRFS